MATQPERPQLPPMEIPSDLQPIYSNLVRISHSAAEIVFDFACLLPAQPAPKIQTRVVMSPMGAKMFLRALTDNLGRYESAFGPVQLPIRSFIGRRSIQTSPAKSAGGQKVSHGKFQYNR